jgi:hypothetical protein
VNLNRIFFFREEEEEIQPNRRSQFVTFTGCTITEINNPFFEDSEIAANVYWA